MSAYPNEIVDNIKEVIAFVTATAGGGFALWRWTVDQKWRRVQHAQSLIEDFFDNENVAKACEIIDTDEKVELDEDEDSKKSRKVEISEEFLLQSFSIFLKKRNDSDGPSVNDLSIDGNRTQDDGIVRKDKNTGDENYVRWVFDDFFGRLSDFQSHIEAGLIQLRDISPYLEYWMKELSGRGNIRGKQFSRQLDAYLRYFGYDRVLQLAKSMGYPIG
jgi:hypothetical protein